ncbi:fusaric acid resistance family protein [Micromonospora sp. A202]|uniref:FUSC family protein n=1 Tax=Micromonospora sp. A202 TaxID=2572899 RepID=UPI00114E9136|nr:FUSC family protein [Micromonospora sp. A202]TQJ23634.1 fusaric acid resistance family protein [Micromonospora sp. A202]
MKIIGLIAVQVGLAAALAWWLAHDLLGNPNPVFAPTAAVGTIAAAIGQRTRRTIELLVGVGLGITIGDGLVRLIGTGPWQTGIIVAIAIAIASALVGRGGTVVSQVGGTAVLIATLSSSQRIWNYPESSTRSPAAWLAWWWWRCCCPCTPCASCTGRPRRSSTRSPGTCATSRRRCAPTTRTARHAHSTDYAPWDRTWTDSAKPSAAPKRW